jgi:hypothetical protein
MLKQIIDSNPPVSMDQIATFESRWQINLPEAYQNFLLKNNGGEPIPATFPITGLPLNPKGEIQAFFGLRAEIESEDLNWVLENLNGPQPLGVLPIAVTPVGDYLCLDTLKPENPVVYWSQRENWGDGSNNLFYPVANSFEDLLNVLE